MLLTPTLPDLCRSPVDYQAFKIHPDERHRLAISFDPHNAPTDLVSCVEIFDPGGETPFHQHQCATELFFVIKGTGFARFNDTCSRLQPGDSVLIPPQRWHQVGNLGGDRLYLLCVMSPNEGFSELIRQGVTASLDAEDLATLARSWTALPG
jgi:mannose-6-phosphate isomerase-like protein (cupin superfamily)